MREVYHTLKKLKEEGYSTGVRDVGGFALTLRLEVVLGISGESHGKERTEPGTDMKIAIDAASSELYDEASGMYLFPGRKPHGGERKSGAAHRRWWITTAVL